ncbi:MAG: MarR family transcriptional regulator [Alphaproteobacteria bacterium]|nr:MarR family transcriptional regulator [Alphaproteobacteria bacterium]
MTDDVIKERAVLFLGSRLKRLAERMQGDVVRFAERAGLAIQPSQYSLLVTIDAYGPQTIGGLTGALQLSQPAVTRTVARLTDLGLVEMNRMHRDQRHKTVSLTEAGKAALLRSRLLVFPKIEAAVADLLDGLAGPLLDQIAEVEDRLNERPLDRRGEGGSAPALTIRDYDDDLAHHFREINEQWITAMYSLEPAEIELLADPGAHILDPGGAILFVEAEGLGIVGTCALRKTGPGEFELTKMGVIEAARGCKAGAFLLKAVIARAEEMGAATLYLLSNRKSAAAIHLYEKLGFLHDDEIMRRFGARYERCDVAMRYAGPPTGAEAAPAPSVDKVRRPARAPV